MTLLSVPGRRHVAYGPGLQLSLAVFEAWIGVFLVEPGQCCAATFDYGDANPLLEHVITQSPVADLLLQGDMLFVAEGAGGIHVFDVADPRALHEVQFVAGTEGAIRLKNGPGCILAAAGAYGLLVLRGSPPLVNVATRYEGRTNGVATYSFGSPYCSEVQFVFALGDSIEVLTMSPSYELSRYGTALLPGTNAVADLVVLDGGPWTLPPPGSSLYGGYARAFAPEGALEVPYFCDGHTGSGGLLCEGQMCPITRIGSSTAQTRVKVVESSQSGDQIDAEVWFSGSATHGVPVYGFSDPFPKDPVSWTRERAIVPYATDVVHDFVKDGRLAYLATGNDLQVVDTADGDSLLGLWCWGGWLLGDNATAVAMEENTLFVGYDDGAIGKVAAIDVTDPTLGAAAACVLSRTATIPQASCIAAVDGQSGPMLCVGGYGADPRILDIG